jgi:hypothetical protein
MATSLTFGFWWAVTKSSSPKGSRASGKFVGGMVAVGCFFGFSCVLADRITSFSIPHVGSLQAVTAQAITDAAQVADLRTRVEHQSATVDLVASQAAKAATLSESVASQIKEAEQKLGILNAAIEEAKTAVEALKQEGDFTLIVLKAENDDRRSLDQLWVLAQDPNYRFKDTAQHVWISVVDGHASPFFQNAPNLPWAEGVDPIKLSINQLAELYNSGQVYKPSVLQYIAGRKDIPLIERLDLFVSVMKTDESLICVEYASRYFEQETHQDTKYLWLPIILPWWEAHRNDFGAETKIAP